MCIVPCTLLVPNCSCILPSILYHVPLSFVICCISGTNWHLCPKSYLVLILTVSCTLSLYLYLVPHGSCTLFCPVPCCSVLTPWSIPCTMKAVLEIIHVTCTIWPLLWTLYHMVFALDLVPYGLCFGPCIICVLYPVPSTLYPDHDKCVPDAW